MKIKTAALVLLIGSILWLADLLYFAYSRFFGDNAKYYTAHVFDNIVSTLFLLVPVSFIIFSCALYARKPKTAQPQTAEGQEQQDLLQMEAPNMTVGNWLATFFVAIIPLIGLIFLIVWAADNEKPIRKTWAIATLIWSMVVIVLSVLLLLWARSASAY